MVMISKISLIAFLGLLGFSVAQSTPSTNASTSSLNFTTISASGGNSIIECWQLLGLMVSTEKGTIGAQSLFLGNTSNATYSVLPGGFIGGLHNAPSAQVVSFVAGLVHITLPNSTEEAWIQGGRYGTILAVDTADISKFGHETSYPSGFDTVAIEIPFADGMIPNHTVLHPGPCGCSEMTGSFPSVLNFGGA